MTVTSPTAGQRVATNDLRDAVRARRPLILLFGDTGAGKTSVINAFLSTTEPDEILAIAVSATGSEFVTSPTFESLLAAICKRLGLPVLPDQRPALLVGMATLLRATAEANKAVVVAVDHADRLSDDVIAEFVRLHEYLGVPSATLVRIFVGTLDLASRIELVLRRAGSDERLTEIRVSPPTADEVATILTYEDAARPGEPLLTPEAIGTICAYASGDLHLATPMADAARSHADAHGAGEVTADLVHEALLDIWSPEQGDEGAVATGLAPLDLGGTNHRSRSADARWGLFDSAIQPEVSPEPAPRQAPPPQRPSWQQPPSVFYRRVKAKLQSRQGSTLLVGAGVLSLLAALGVFALLAGQNGEPRQPEGDSTRHLQSEAGAITSPDVPNAVSNGPVGPAEPGAPENDRKPEANPSDAQTLPVAPAPVDLGKPVPAANAAQRNARVRQKPASMKPAPKPEGRTSEPWVQLR